MRRLQLKGFEVGKLIGESQKLRLYLGERDGEKAIIKVAKTFEDGDILAEEARHFSIVRSFADRIAKIEREEGETNSHYDWLFSELKASFMEPTQDDRRINIHCPIDADLDDLVAMPKLRENEIDARTSVWMMGRLFKIYAFYEYLAEDGDIPLAQYPCFSDADYLIDPQRHRLIYYNYSGDAADVTANRLVKTIAQYFLNWAIPRGDESEQEYFALLEDFAELGRPEFRMTHTELYRLVKKLWGIKYYPFTFRTPGSETWKHLKED